MRVGKHYYKLIVGVSMALTLVTGCFYQDTGPPPPQIVNIDSSIAPPGTVLQITNKLVLMRTGPYHEAPEALASSARIFVGQTFAAEAQAPKEFSFEWYTRDSCKALPQGDNLIVRYEMYNDKGEVVQTDHITADIHSCG